MKTYSVRIRDAVDKVQKDDIDARYRADYSGRGMYSKSCSAIVGRKTDCRAVIAEAIIQGHADNMQEADFSDFVEVLLNYETDNMGHDVVLFWPAIQHEE